MAIILNFQSQLRWSPASKSPLEPPIWHWCTVCQWDFWNLDSSSPALNVSSIPSSLSWVLHWKSWPKCLAKPWWQGWTLNICLWEPPFCVYLTIFIQRLWYWDNFFHWPSWKRPFFYGCCCHDFVAATTATFLILSRRPSYCGIAPLAVVLLRSVSVLLPTI